MNEIKSPFMFSSIPAGWTDRLILKAGGQSRIGSLGLQFLARLINVTVLPVFLAMDLTLEAIKIPKEYLIAILPFTSFKYHVALAHQSADLAKKCFIALLATPFSLINPQFVSLPFVEDSLKKDAIEPFGKLMSAKAEIFYPTKPQQVQNLVKQAKKDHRPISIIGSGMSQGGHTLPSENAVNPLALNLNQLELSHRNIKIEILENQSVLKTEEGFFYNNFKSKNSCEKKHLVAREKTRAVARVSGGVTWQELQNAADDLGYAVKVAQASNVFSVGGSIAANSYGFSQRQGPLGNTIVSLTIIDAEGKIKTLTPCDELFGYVLGGYGAFGVIVEAEIVLTKNRTLQESGELVALEDFVKHFEDNVFFDKSICEVICRVPLKEEKEMVLINKFSKVPNDPFYHKPSCSSTKSKLLSRNQATPLPVNVLKSNSKASAEWLQEYFVGGATLEQRSQNVVALQKKVREIIKKYNIQMTSCSWSYVTEDFRAELGYSRGKEGAPYALALSFNQSLSPKKIEETKAWQRELVDFVTQIGGTYYLPYQDSATVEQFRGCYKEQVDKVIARKQAFDPDHRFKNRFIEKYFV